MPAKEHNIQGLEKFRSQLKKNDMKATAQRTAVHEAMMELGHACAEDVETWIRKNSETKITQASIYNILSQMADLGIYSSRLSADSKKYFDVSAHPHFHLYDCVSHRFKDVMNDKLYQDVLECIGSRRFRGYTIERVDIQFVVRPTGKKKI